MSTSEWMFEILIALILMSSFVFVAVITRRERKLCRDTMQLMGEMILGYERQLHNAMLLIKSTTPSEAVKAAGESKTMDLKVKYLQDALAQAEVDAKPPEPTFVTTTDGRKIDVRELEVM